MALTGTFIADFSSFYDAVQKADVQLKTLGDGAGKVGSQLNRMVDQFSGRKLIQDATVMERAIEEIGGVAKLTEKELTQVSAKASDALAKMKALGMEAPVGLQKLADAGKPVSSWFERMTGLTGQLAQGLKLVGIGFGVDAIIGFTKSILANADALTKLEAKTGISIRGLQLLQAAAEDAGNTLEDITAAVTAGQNKMAGGDKAFREAAESLGLSVRDLQALSPDDFFVAVSTALRTVDDPARQVALAMDLMGKAGVNALPTLKRGFDDLYGAIIGPSPEAVKALDNVGDAAGRLWARLKAGATEALGKAADMIQRNPRGFVMQYLYGISDPEEVIREAERAARAVDPFIQKTLELNKAKQAAPIAAPLAKKDLIDAELANAQLTRLEAEDRERRAKAKKATEDQDEAQKKLNQSLREYNNWLVEREFADVAEQMKRDAAATAVAAKETEQFNTILRHGASDLELFARNVPPVGQLVKASAQTLEQATPIFKGFGTFLKTQLGDSILKAFQGGGDIAGSIGSSLGGFLTRAGGGLQQAVSGVFGEKGFGKWIGDALGSALPGIGSLLGGLGAKLFGKLFDNPEKQINPIREAFVQAAGGLDELNQKAAAAGVTLTQLLDAKNPQQYEAAIKSLQAAFDVQTQSMAALDEATKRYGFTIEELGPALQRQELDKQAQQLFKDWEVLNAAGINTVAITNRMADATNAYLHQALKVGAEVPEAMRPMLEQMVQAGQLYDANGNKIEHLEDAGISFSMTMSQGFKQLIAEVGKLTDAISRGLGLAVDTTSAKLRGMPKQLPVDIVYRDPGFERVHEVEVRYSSPGAPVESYQEGTNGFRNFGAGTPVMLHGWEAVVPRDRASTEGPMPPLLAAGADGGGDIVIHTHLVLDGRELATAVERVQNADFTTRNRLRAA